MQKQNKVNVALIATGRGTDGYAIMKAWKSNCMPNIDIKCLISTKHGAGCLARAKKAGVTNCTIARDDYSSLDTFNIALAKKLQIKKVKIIFLVGCLVKIYPIKGIVIYNIHPSDINKHGGKGMHGLAVHKHVLLEIKDQINRNKKTVQDNFFTYPTIHEAVLEYDAGDVLMRCAVKIPQQLVQDLVNNAATLTKLAELLEQLVLSYEWLMLPCAVQIAGQKVLSLDSIKK